MRRFLGFDGPVIGLDQTHHLRRVIADDLPQLDCDRAEAELISYLSGQLDGIEAVLLNAQSAALQSRAGKTFDVAVYDILNAIDELTPGLVRPAFL